MNEKLFTGDFVKISNFNQENFVGEGSSPLSCRKYLWTVNPVFRKIYAHKWLCIAVCGHNIFLVTISWRRRRDSNPCGVSPKRFSRPPRYDHFDTSPTINYNIIYYITLYLISQGLFSILMKFKKFYNKCKR